MSLNITRRHCLQTAGLALTAHSLPLLAAAESGRFTTRHGAPTQSITPGEHVLADNNGRRTLLYIPPAYNASQPMPLFMMLHGASGNGERTLSQERAAADEHGVILLCPSSRSGTWDAIRGDFSYDFDSLNDFLQQTFNRCNIDAMRMAVGGFSDGASYGISLGLINGDFFTHVIAHSPGFIIADNFHGKPKVFISHGTEDEVLPFDRCGAVINARLQRAGYNPRFDTFAGGHTASPELRSAALAWLKS